MPSRVPGSQSALNRYVMTKSVTWLSSSGPLSAAGPTVETPLRDLILSRLQAKGYESVGLG